MTTAATADRTSKPEEGSALATALEQFETAADFLDLHENIRQILRYPKRELIVNFPVGMDDGSVHVFTG